MDVSTLADIAGIGAGAASIGGGAMAVYKAYQRSKKFFARVNQGMVSLETVTSEFRPNGGSTIKDKVDKIVAELTTVRSSRAVDELMTSMLAGWAHPPRCPAIAPFKGPTPWNTVIFKTNARGLWVWASPQWRILTGVESDQAEGSGWLMAVSNEHREDVERSWESAVTESRDFIMNFAVQHLVTGEVTEVRCHAVAAFTLDDQAVRKVAGWVGRLEGVLTDA